MTEWEKAEAGLLYDAKYDPDLDRGRKASQELSFDYNALRPSQIKEREEMVRKHFKKTGKRVFKMTPIHHHFELSGWTENKVVIVFSLVTLLVCIIGLKII